MTSTETYVGWLSDAYSTEVALISALEEHIQDAGQFPQLAAGLQMHLEQTRRHADLIKGCLERQGGATSGLKTTFGKVANVAKSVMNSTVHDEVMKNTIDDFVAENLEIASYTSLLAAAEALGDTQTARVCTLILSEEEHAEALLRQQLPVVAMAALRGAASATA